MERTTKKRTLRVTRHSPDVERDVTDEIEFHLEMRTQELIDDGLDPVAAARLAREAFGDRADIEAECRQVSATVSRRRRGADAVSSLAGDVRLGLRQIGRRPGLSCIILATWALTLGANTGIFSLVHGILLQPLPYPQPDDLVTVVRSLPDAGVARLGASLGDYVDLRDRVPGLKSVALHNQVSSGIGDAGHVRNVFSSDVTAAFFDVLGVRATRGRTFSAEDAESGATARVVISHELWQAEFGGARDVVGRELVADGVAHTVIGVLPEGFLFGDWEAQLWLPLPVPHGASQEELRRRGGFDIVARLAPGATPAVVQTQVDAVDAATLRLLPAEEQRHLTEGGYRSEVRRIRDDLVHDVRPALLLLWGGALFVLLIGCVNIATLLLVRNTTRVRELATRFALGAGRVRVIRQLVTESLLLAVLGSAIGFALGAWSLRLLDVFEAYEIPRVADVGLGGWAVGFVLALTTLVGLAAGLLPALAVSSEDLHAVLRSGTMPGTSGRRQETLSGGLVAVQLAVAFVLLAGTGLMLSSLVRLQAVDPGFETDGVLAAATVIPWDRYPTPPVRYQAIHDMLESMGSIPGVERAAVASQLPFSGVGDQEVIEAESGSAPSDETLAPFATIVSPGYFETLGIPLRDGRLFTEDDGMRTHPVALVDEELAHRAWPGDRAVGKRLRLVGDERWFTVVGILGNVVQDDLASPERNGALYLPYRESQLTFMRLALRTTVSPSSVLPSLRERLVALNPDARVFWVLSMSDALDESLAFQRLPLYLMVGFAALALLLSTLGVYGVLTHSVTARTRELGLRKALGGTAWDLTALTLRRGLTVVAVGLAAGATGALALSRLLESVLYEVRPYDPTVFTAVAAVLALVGLSACLLPARRAVRVEPVSALKAD